MADDAYQCQGDEEADEIFPVYSGEKGDKSRYKIVEAAGKRYDDEQYQQRD